MDAVPSDLCPRRLLDAPEIDYVSTLASSVQEELSKIMDKCD